MSKLRPCPFCGGVAIKGDNEIWCGECFAGTNETCSPTVDWNKRVESKELDQANKRIAELQEELQQMNHAAKELHGVIGEYQAAPCESLLKRMTDTANRYKKTIFDNIIGWG